MGVEGFITAIVDLYPNVLRRGYRKELFIAGMSAFWCLIGLTMVTEVCTRIGFPASAIDCLLPMRNRTSDKVR